MCACGLEILEDERSCEDFKSNRLEYNAREELDGGERRVDEEVI
jgi:hypothetical protein